MLLDPNPPEFPAPWAVAYGEDGYGFWQAFRIEGVRQVMRWIPPGRFWMGSPDEEPKRYEDEIRHLVTLMQGFWLAETACTQALWQAVTGHNPARFTDSPDHPVEQVSWEDCQRFLERANGMLGGSLRLNLPTEAQWEYTCRAGTQTPFSFGATLTTDLANYDGRYSYDEGQKGVHRAKTLAVQAFAPNPWGLYQMHGNVYEWCRDWYGDYPAEPVVDPEGPEEGKYRVLRGGSWIRSGQRLRSAYRNHYSPDFRSHFFGFRLAAG